MIGRTFLPSPQVAPTLILWRTAMLSIPGSMPVTIAMCSDRQACATLAVAMLRIDEGDLDLAMIDEFMRELVNMTAGQIKGELHLDQALGLSRVIDGEPLLTSPVAWTHHVLDSDKVTIVVSLVASMLEGRDSGICRAI